MKPDDIAIIFLDTDQYIYQSASSIERAIGVELGMECNIAYESKKTEKGKILISNKNNVKGLEYPFVICITKKFLKKKVIVIHCTQCSHDHLFVLIWYYLKAMTMVLPKKCIVVVNVL